MVPIRSREASVDLCRIHQVEKWRQERTSRHGKLGQDWESFYDDPFPFTLCYKRVDLDRIVCCLWHRLAMTALAEPVINVRWRCAMEDRRMAKKKLVDVLSKVSKNGSAGEKAFDEEFEAACPLVHLLMTETELEKGKGRQTCTVVIYAAHGLFNVIMTERDKEMKIFAGGGSVSEMWASLEERVGSPDPDWVSDTKKKR